MPSALLVASAARRGNSSLCKNKRDDYHHVGQGHRGINYLWLGDVVDMVVGVESAPSPSSASISQGGKRCYLGATDTKVTFGQREFVA